MKLTTTLAGVAMAVLGVASASAADMRLPARAPAPAPVLQRIFSWTGFYAGLNIGYGWTNGSGTATITGIGTGPFSGSGGGVAGGAQIGYNWQAGSVVFGLETDIQASGGTGTVTGTGGLAGFTANTRNNYFGTIRGRLGYAFDRWMVYVTGGAAYGENSLSGVVPAGAYSLSSTYWTYTVGGGIETALWDRWSVKAEYLYGGPPNNVPVPPGTTAMTGSSNSHLLRAGINYRF